MSRGLGTAQRDLLAQLVVGDMLDHDLRTNARRAMCGLIRRGLVVKRGGPDGMAYQFAQPDND